MSEETAPQLPASERPPEPPPQKDSSGQSWLWVMVGVIVLISLTAGGIVGFSFGRLYESSHKTVDADYLYLLLGGEVSQRADGVYLERVDTSGPAYSAGLLEGDRLERVGGERVESAEQVKRLLADYRPGDQVLITVERSPWISQYAVTLGYYLVYVEYPVDPPVVPVPVDPPLPQPQPNTNEEARLGVYYRMLEADDPFGVDDGALIVSVWSGGAADRAGLAPGDIITGVGGMPVAGRTDLGFVLDNFRAGESVRLTVYTGGSHQNVRVTLDG
jgi:S1-C subfamily serine protease